VERGVSNAWGHIFHLYGPGEHPSRLVPSVIRTLDSGEAFVCRHPDDVRDFLHVDDVASAFVALLGSAVQGDVNIASGQPTRVDDLVSEIAAVMGRSDLHGITPEQPPRSTALADASRLREQVGWTPRWTRQAAIGSCIRWWT
jgi:UDP-glucuronate decarboxylase